MSHSGKLPNMVSLIAEWTPSLNSHCKTGIGHISYIGKLSNMVSLVIDCILSESRGTSDEYRSRSMGEFRHSGAEPFLVLAVYVACSVSQNALPVELTLCFHLTQTIFYRFSLNYLDSRNFSTTSPHNISLSPCLV
jgi:hypothetical protein